jgi:hypothetical protein
MEINELQIVSWDSEHDFKISHLMSLKPEMISDSGYLQEFTNDKKGITALVKFDKQYVVERLAGIFDDLGLYSKEEVVGLISLVNLFRGDKLQKSREDEIRKIIAKYGDSAVKQVLDVI